MEQSDLPTIQIEFADEFKSEFNPGSLAALWPGLLVIPKAVKLELANII